jgi:hypothetical protein
MKLIHFYSYLFGFATLIIFLIHNRNVKHFMVRVDLDPF